MSRHSRPKRCRLFGPATRAVLVGWSAFGCAVRSPQFDTISELPAPAIQTSAPTPELVEVVAPVSRKAAYWLIAEFFRRIEDPSARLDAVLDPGARIRLGSQTVVYQPGRPVLLDLGSPGSGPGISFDRHSLTLSPLDGGDAVASAEVSVTGGPRPGRWTFILSRAREQLLISDAFYRR